MERGTPSSVGLLVVFLLLLILSAAAAAADGPPRVLATFPVDGSDRVPSDTGSILVVFDRDMARDGHSLVGAKGGETPPVTGAVRWLGPRAVSIGLGVLPAGRTFALGLNSEKHRGFRSAEGVPLAPSVLRFASAPSGGRSRPVVARVDPAPGAVGVDPGLAEILVTFAQDVKPGRMSLLRVAGAEVLGYVRERPPYMKSPRVLAIPVKLRPGVTYGASVNGPGKSGFVAAATGEPFLPHPIVFTTGKSSGTKPAAAVGLIGRWTMSESGVRISIELYPDGRYVYEETFEEETEATRGVWREDGATLVFKEDGAAEPLRVPFRLPDATSLEVKLEDTWIRLAREGGPVRAVRKLDGVWQWRDGSRGLRFTLGADGRYESRRRTEAGESITRGRWRDLGKAIETVPDGAKPVRIPCRLVDENTIELTLGAGGPIRLTRAKAADREPAAVTKPVLVGTWAWSGNGAEVRIVLGADGRFTYHGREGEEVEDTRGTWRDLGRTLEIREDGGAESIRVPYRFIGGRLEIEIDGTRVPLERQE